MAMAFGTVREALAPTRKAGRKATEIVINADVKRVIDSAIVDVLTSKLPYLIVTDSVDDTAIVDGENPFDTVVSIRAYCKRNGIAYGKPRNVETRTAYVHACARDASGKAITVSANKSKAEGFTFYISRVDPAE